MLREVLVNVELPIIGFKPKQKVDLSYFTDIFEYIGKDSTYLLTIKNIKDDDIITIERYTKDGISNTNGKDYQEWKWSVLFQGKIKNSSELKVLLKQLGIDV